MNFVGVHAIKFAKCLSVRSENSSSRTHLGHLGQSSSLRKESLYVSLLESPRLPLEQLHDFSLAHAALLAHWDQSVCQIVVFLPQ